MAVDHDQRDVLGDRGILETVVHHDHAGAERTRHGDAVGALARDHHRQRGRQHQRLIADFIGDMPLRIDPHRAAQFAAIAAAEHHGRFAEIAQQLRQRQHGRRLAGAADVIIADAEHGDAGIQPLRAASVSRRWRRRVRRAVLIDSISGKTGRARSAAHAFAAPISSRNCNRYGSRAISVRSSAPPSCSTTRSEAASEASRALGSASS